MIKVSDFIAKFIAEHKDTAKTVFMVSGGGNMHLIDSLGKNKNLEYVCNHHEQACAIAAEGYARVSNKIGIAYVTTGPCGDGYKRQVEEGIVVGGGSALILASKSVNLNLQGDEAIGAEIVRRALRAPLRQIAENAGFDAGVVANAVETSKDANFGFNAATGEYVNMFEAGIIDPVKVERVALQNAVSVASLLLTTEATISEIKEEKAMPAMPDMGGMGGMGGMM